MADSRHIQIRDAVRDELKTMDLDGIQSDNIVSGKVPTDRKGLLPTATGQAGILVCTYGNASQVGGLNDRDDIGYQILIVMIQPSNANATENEDRAAYWSERISSRFRNRRLTAVPTVYTTRLLQDTKFDPGAFFDANKDVNAIIFRFDSRETRG